MNPAIILPSLKAHISQIMTFSPSLRFYIFGSFARQAASPSDIDILVICSSDFEADLSRSLLKAACHQWPLHLTIMTASENHETDFLEKFGAISFEEFCRTSMANIDNV